MYGTIFCITLFFYESHYMKAVVKLQSVGKTYLQIHFYLIYIHSVKRKFAFNYNKNRFCQHKKKCYVLIFDKIEIIS